MFSFTAAVIQPLLLLLLDLPVIESSFKWGEIVFILFYFIHLPHLFAFFVYCYLLKLMLAFSLVP